MRSSSFPTSTSYDRRVDFAHGVWGTSPAASIFHYGTYRIRVVKQYMQHHGLPMRQYNVKKMSTFKHPISLADATGQRFIELEPWVDTAAHLSQFPASLLRQLGYEPRETTRFQDADGSIVELPVGQADIAIGDRIWTIPVTFGEEEAPMLLGATALKIFRLMPDPVFHILRPIVAMRLTRLLDRTDQQP